VPLGGGMYSVTDPDGAGPLTATLTVTLGTSLSGYVIADAVRIERLPPLQAATAPTGDSTVVSRLNEADIQSALTAALTVWAAADPSSAARLENVRVQVADLPSGVLGLASKSQSRIWLDADAAGLGWSANPQSAIGVPARAGHPQSIDLLTVVTHELGHVLGLPDLDPLDHPRDVMAGRLDAGLRRLPLGGELVTDTSAMRLRQPVVTSADHLFADLGALFDGNDRDPISEIGQRQRDELATAASREPNAGRFPLKFERVLDDEEDLFADNSDRPTARHDEESADQLFAELFDDLND